MNLTWMIVAEEWRVWLRHVRNRVKAPPAISLGADLLGAVNLVPRPCCPKAVIQCGGVEGAGAGTDLRVPETPSIGGMESCLVVAGSTRLTRERATETVGKWVREPSGCASRGRRRLADGAGSAAGPRKPGTPRTYDAAGEHFRTAHGGRAGGSPFTPPGCGVHGGSSIGPVCTKRPLGGSLTKTTRAH